MKFKSYFGVTEDYPVIVDGAALFRGDTGGSIYSSNNGALDNWSIFAPTSRSELDSFAVNGEEK